MNKTLCPCCGSINSLKRKGAGYRCSLCNSIVKEPLEFEDDKED